MIVMDKTIPYRPSPADLENLRILRKKIKSFDSDADGEEENPSEDINIWNSNPGPVIKVVENEKRG
jgi:hypothetical protein